MEDFSLAYQIFPADEKPILAQNQLINNYRGANNDYLVYQYHIDNQFQTYLTDIVFQKNDNSHIEKLPQGSFEINHNLMHQAIKSIDDFHSKFNQDPLWRLRNPIIHLEFEQLRGYDVIASYQWDYTLSLIKKLDYCPAALELSFSHNNIDSGIYYSDQTTLVNFDYAACNYKIFDLSTLLNTYYLKYQTDFYVEGRTVLYYKYLNLFRRLSALLYSVRYYSQNQKTYGNKFLELYFLLSKSKN